MFFGSGNLVFPIAIGVETYGYALYANLGLFVTGIIVPWIGLMSAVCSGFNQRDYFALLGPKVGWVICFLMLCLIGPLGVCPRCTLVAFGGLKVIYPTLSLWSFSLIFCALSVFIVIFDRKLIMIIGKYLTPLLLVGIFIIIFANFFTSSAVVQVGESPHQSLLIGASYGYHTMDLMGALFFGFTTRSFFLSESGKMTRLDKQKNIISSTGGMLLLAMVYSGLVYLGGKYNAHLIHAPPENYIVSLSDAVLGEKSRYIAAMISFLACLTTIVVLMKLFGEFLQKELLKNRINFQQSVTLTALITFIISLTGFTSLSQWLGLFLQTIYPALVVFALTAYFIPNKPTFIRVSFWITVLCVNIYFYYYTL